MHKIDASQFFIIGVEGKTLTEQEREFLQNRELGGVILFSKNIESIEQIIELNTSIIEANPAHTPLLSIDQEGGRVARLRGFATDLPPMAHLLKQYRADLDVPYKIGALIGRELVSLGFNLDFAPVLDVVPEDIFLSRQHVIGDRCFSYDPKEVASFTARFIEGLQGQGIAACGKHFPGHGNTLKDSHLELPTIRDDAEKFRVRDLIPFIAAIKKNVATIMTAHIQIPAFDNEYPATLSVPILQGILRDELGFNGVIISDDLDMKAMADHFDTRFILEKGLRASVDMFIVGHNFAHAVATIDALQDLIDQDEELNKKAAEALSRIEHLRKCYLGAPKAPELSYAKTICRSKPHLDLVASLL